MRHVKVIGLAAVAAVAATAFVGAGSAMATGSSVICTNNSLPCNSPAGAGLHFVTVGEPLLQTTTPKLHILCLSSLLSGNAEALGNPTGVTLTALTWTGCYTLPKGATHNCEVNTITTGLIDVLKTAKDLGTATALGTEILVKCGEILHCVYGGKETKGAVGESALHTAAAGNGRVIAAGIPIAAVGGTLCPASTNVTATFSWLGHAWISS